MYEPIQNGMIGDIDMLQHILTDMMNNELKSGMED